MGRAFILPNINFQNSGLGSVTLLGDAPVRMISIIGPSIVAADGAQFSLRFAPLNTAERSVSWSIVAGSEYATISSSGYVTPLPGSSNNQVTIRAVSTADENVVAEKTISVSSSSVVFYDYLLTDGASYFDIGKIGRNDRITIKGKTLSVVPSSASAIWGVAKDSSGANWIYQLHYAMPSSSSLGRFAISLGNTAGEYQRLNIDPNSSEFITIIDIASGTITVASTTGSATIGEAAFENGLTPYNAYCFAANKGGTAVSVMIANAFALAELIIERGGEIIHDFKPAELGGVFGPYDTVTGDMAQNLGAGAFSVE